MRSASRVLVTLVLALTLVAPLLAQDDLVDLEQQAIREAVARVEPSVVQIETVGGLEKVGDVLFGTGPTTGLAISADGYIVSSAFNFAQRPASILVRLPNGNRWPAKLIATDHARQVVLLKVQSEEKFVPAVPCPEKEIEVGQWAIAVGRTFEGGKVNVSEGVISAIKRIHGRGLQTDAKVSPSNYGGPLVDIRGRVQGILVPLSTQGSDKVAGVEWYDAGIAFAVPLEHVLSTLPRLKQGKDLHPGIMGVNMRSGNPFADAAVIAAVRANSPAYKAGFKQDDTIVEVDGRAIVRQMQVQEALGPHYAGDRIRVAVTRGKERIERELELIDKLEAYSRPFLGVLPLRVAKETAKKEKEKEKEKAAPAASAPGVVVRHVYANSPADTAGLEEGDRIVSVNGKAVADREALRESVSSLTVGAKATIELLRGDDKARKQIAVQLAAVPEAIPAKLPLAMLGRKPYLGAQPPVGKQPLKLPDVKNECFVYVPLGYDPAVAHGVVIWLHEPGGLREPKQLDELIARWKPLCDAHDLILVAPKAEDPVQWNPGKEVPFVAQIVEKVRSTYRVDDTRIVAHGFQAGGSMAYALAFQRRELVRGVAAIDAPLAGTPPEHEPVYPLAFYTTLAQTGRLKPPQTKELVTRLRGMKYPVTVKDLGKEARHLNPEELVELVRWIDTLDRI